VSRVISRERKEGRTDGQTCWS